MWILHRWKHLVITWESSQPSLKWHSNKEYTLKNVTNMRGWQVNYHRRINMFFFSILPNQLSLWHLWRLDPPLSLHELNFQKKKCPVGNICLLSSHWDCGNGISTFRSGKRLLLWMLFFSFINITLEAMKQVNPNVCWNKNRFTQEFVNAEEKGAG